MNPARLGAVLSIVKTKILTLLLLPLLGSSCSTSYDQYGRPRQAVDPGAAVLATAAAGVIGYQVSKNRYKDGYKQNKYYSTNRGYNPRYNRGYNQPNRYYNSHPRGRRYW